MASVINLPAVMSDAPLPRGREFYGAISRKFSERGLAFGEVFHGEERNVPKHAHESSYYSLVISGAYDESGTRQRIYYQPFNAAYVRAGTEHDGHISRHGARIFTIEIGHAWIEQLREWRPEPDTVQDLSGGELCSLGIRLYTEYCTQRLGCSLTIDALIWELLDSAAHDDATARLESNPIWWTRVIDLLHAEFSRSIRISEVAAEAGVHPGHLARVFRRICHETPGEYVQRLRVRFAAEKLANAKDDIASIAAEAGFADQNHLTRIFKKYVRMTPGAFRRSCRSS